MQSDDAEAYVASLPRGERRRALAQIAIEDCGELLAEIPAASFPRILPHPYIDAGAPYGTVSPYCLREGALEKLFLAQSVLKARVPGYTLLIYDGYRPLRVQAYMVDYTVKKLAREDGLKFEELNGNEREALRGRALQIFAPPEEAPALPPPHSTGGAVDLTIADENGRPLDMGSQIDDMPPLCLPNHFRDATDPSGKEHHANRELLREVMTSAGFSRLPHEWWHFSYGDQLWAYLERLRKNAVTSARYGRYDLLPEKNAEKKAEKKAETEGKPLTESR